MRYWVLPNVSSQLDSPARDGISAKGNMRVLKNPARDEIYP